MKRLLTFLPIIALLLTACKPTNHLQKPDPKSPTFDHYLYALRKCCKTMDGTLYSTDSSMQVIWDSKVINVHRNEQWYDAGFDGSVWSDKPVSRLFRSKSSNAPAVPESEAEAISNRLYGGCSRILDDHGCQSILDGTWSWNQKKKQ